MKTITSLALLPAMMLALAASSTLAAPTAKTDTEAKAAPKPLQAEISINPIVLAPNSTIEVVFPTPMIARERIGQTEETSPVIVTPELTGSFEWTSTRSGHFHLTQAPKFASSYDFKLRSGLNDLEGRTLSTERLASVQSARFRLIDQHPRWFNDDAENRSPRFLFEFNDNVTPAEAAKHIGFTAEDAPPVKATVRHATGKDFSRMNADADPTWAEEISKVKPTLADDAVRLSALVVEPESPLPVAKGWRLLISEKLTNAAGHNSLATGDDIQIGEIRPFEVRSIEAHTPFDSDYYVEIYFNKRLLPPSDTEMTDEMVEAFVQKIVPFVTVRRMSVGQKLAAVVNKDEGPLTGLKAEVTGRTLRLSGPFEANKKYQVTVAQALTSGDNLPLKANFQHEVTFIPNPPYVAAPAFINAQLAKGEGSYEFSAANVKQVRVRAKRLNGPELLKAVDQYRAYQTAYYGNDKQKAAYKTPSIDAYPGTQVFDRTFPVNKPLDQSEILKLNWREVLGDYPAAPLVIELEGTAADGVKEKGVVTQSLVQFTDLGIMQKSSGRETMVFVTSLETGRPVPGVRLTLVDSDLKLVGYGDTDASGIATAPGATPAFVLAEKAGDCAVIEVSDGGIGIPYDINQAWESVWQPQRRTFVFSDRPLYKPGDTAHFKAHTRLLTGDDLSLDPAPAKGRLVIRDPRYRVIVDKPVTFTAAGAWADDVALPTGPAGWYDVSLRLKAPDGNSQSSDGGHMSFRIDDYKPNTFEVKLDSKSVKFEADRMKLALSANYFMGKALSVAEVAWSANSRRDFMPPEAFRDYHFGEEPSWSHYGQDRDSDGDYIYGEQEDDEDDEWFVNGDMFLGEDGSAVLEMPRPPPDRAALPQIVRVNAEVTDINEQTISAAAQFEVPGADFLLGLRGPQYFATAGKPMNLEVIAIDSKGAPAGGNVRVEWKVERQEYHTLKIATAGGGTTTKDQVVLREEMKQSAELKAATEKSAPSATLAFTPTKGGVYFLTAESIDARSTRVLSRMPFYAVGGGEFPWAMEDGNRMNLQPEKTKLKPGEDAVIVVKTPIAGTALVTLERNKIHRQFVTELTLDNPIIRVPLGEDEFPNAYVSVIVIRGSAASTKQHKMPEYRVGYCALTIESDAKELKLAVQPDHDEVRPAEAVNITTTITDAKGTPVSGADVTLYAVDEGVLSLMTYDIPDPSKFFHAEFPLAIDSFTSFDNLLSEELAMRDRGNKGFVIGGGDAFGMMAPGNIEVRKNFVATPLWLASGTTDAGGKLTTNVIAPDNLTRYRIMAVAAHGVDRFGKGESAFKVNKPLMIDPAVPRFARLGDEFLVKAVVHNTTPHSGAVEVTLDLDETADFIQEKRDFIPASLKPDTGGGAKQQKVILQIKAGQTAATAFPVQFVQLGSAKWTWKVQAGNWPEPASDGTESTFDVNHPVPELRYVSYTRLKAEEPVENLIKDVNPALLEGEGELSLGISNSRLYEARDALDYLLNYPYGCVEQTTSATMPWLALGKYEPLFPEQLGGGKAKEVIQAGVDKLMQMTTDEGGLAYWPGGREPSLWGSAYGGLMLLRARDQGAAIPSEAIDKLMGYLSKRLRGLDEEQDLYNITDSAMALYTLAKAGKPQPAYQNLLFARRDKLPETARLYLALSMCLSDTPEQQIKDTLGWKPPAPPAKDDGKSKTTKPAAQPAPAPVIWSHWAGSGANKALRLICYTHLGLTTDAEALAVSILQSRNGRGEWGNTFTNAWTLTALAAYERSLKKTGEPLMATAHWDTMNQPLNLATGFSSAKVNFALNQTLSAAPLSIALPEGREAFGRVEARSFPPERNFAGENKGYAIERSYEELNMDGTTSGTEDLRVGDMVVVTLKIEIGGGDRYLAIDDALPAVFEAINPEFDTQNAREGDQLPDGTQAWFCDHREIRTDRALFFTDYAPAKGKFSLKYLARVIAEGDTTAPPARIEAMYQPDKYGLSPSQRIRTLPSTGTKVAEK